MWELALTTMMDPGSPADPLIADLLRQAQAGDIPAFERLICLHERRVLAIALRLLGGNLPDAQDAAQIVFLRLHKYLPKLRADDNLSGWLYRVTVNVCMDDMRRRVPTISLEKISGAAQADAPDPERQFSNYERQATLTAGLALLAGKEKAAIVLRDIEGLDTSEVARILAISEATVRSHICSARSKLKKFVNRATGKRQEASHEL